MLERSVKDPEGRSQFPSQELNLGNLDESQESQPSDHQEIEARSKVALALTLIESKQFKDTKAVKTKFSLETQPMGEHTVKQFKSEARQKYTPREKEYGHPL